MCVDNYVFIQPGKKHTRYSILNINISFLTTILIKIKFSQRHPFNSKLILQ